MWEVGLVPVDEAMTAAGLDPDDLLEWVPGCTVACVPSFDGIPDPGAVAIGVRVAGELVMIHFPHNEPVEQMADRIKKAIDAQ